MYDLLESDEKWLSYTCLSEVDGVSEVNLEKNWFKVFLRFQSKIT